MAKAKKLLTVMIFLCTALYSGLWAQEAEAAQERGQDVPQGFIQKMDFVMQFEAGLFLNPEYADLQSAPSPINFQPSIGLLLPNYTHMAVQPTLTFFAMNHLWYEGCALPAEIENRTSTTLSFLLQVPAVFTFFMPKSRIQLSAGAGVMIRYAYLAHGVSAQDSGYTGTASGDIEEMNRWFWQGARWLYLAAGADWLYHISPQLRAGPVLNVSIPLGGLITDKSAQGLIISTGIKICR